jgi:hypothetical protein
LPFSLSRGDRGSAFSPHLLKRNTRESRRIEICPGSERGIDKSVNGNVNSGAIGRLNNQAAAILPQPYGDVYGTGLHLSLAAAMSSSRTRR